MSNSDPGIGGGCNGAGAYGEGLAPGQRSPAPYAASAVPSRGRCHPESECSTRSPFQRDRDRVLHSTAFRRLMHKTQVFVFHEGDHYRTRLTHSLEVAQIARTMARQLRLDEDLAEALALAHDLGHPPFGHAGERALDAATRDWGGFDHNAQSLRVVTQLERKYAGFDGLNLTWETLEGLAKHNGPLTAGPVLKIVRNLESWQGLDAERWASAEAQIAALSDDIAYVTHDIDDGLRARLIALGDLDTASDITAAVSRDASALRRSGEDSRFIYEVTRRMITLMIADVVGETRRRLSRLAPASPEDIRSVPSAVAGFSEAMSSEMARLKAFLSERVYRSSRVMRVMSRAEESVKRLFARYLSDPAAMPDAWRHAAEGHSDQRRARVIADFVAGMTDRYAIAEHARLFDDTLELR